VKKQINLRDEHGTTHRWLTVPEVCDFLSISKSTFYKWRMLGIAPLAKRLPNGDLRIRQDWLNEYMSELPEER
jgi:predicted DNA-binding transcriptional regulator AlpA